jgi:uncharacterized protein YgiM (DUF1202 family)
MKATPYLLFLSVIFLLACSLTTPPRAPQDFSAKSSKRDLTTSVQDPAPIAHTIPVTCTVSAQSLHLRECAGLDCTVIAWLSKDDVLAVEGVDHAWIKVTTPTGQTGWVYSKYCGGMP